MTIPGWGGLRGKRLWEQGPMMGAAKGKRLCLAKLNFQKKKKKKAISKWMSRLVREYMTMEEKIKSKFDFPLTQSLLQILKPSLLLSYYTLDAALSPARKVGISPRSGGLGTSRIYGSSRCSSCEVSSVLGNKNSIGSIGRSKIPYWAMYSYYALRSLYLDTLKNKIQIVLIQLV